DDAAALAAWIGTCPDALAHGTARRLTGQIQATTLRVKLPAVVDATQPALLVATKVERCLSVWTVLSQYPGTSTTVAKRHQILTEQAHTHRTAIGLDLRRQQRRQ